MTVETEIHGTLAASPLPEVLHTLESQNATGVLNLAGGGEIWLSAGQTYLVNSPTAPALGAVLFAADVGSLEEINNLLTLSEPGSSALDHICSEYPDSVVGVQRLIHEHNLNGLFEMMVPSDQQYSFRSDVVNPLGVRFAEPTSELLSKASTRVDTWRKIATQIPSTSAVFQLVHSLPARAEERLVTAEEWRYISYIDGRTSVSSVITATGESAFRVTSALYRLLLEGLIEEKKAT